MFYSNKLKKFTKIKHCFFSRKDGFSKGLYKSLNCGRGSRDNKNNIEKNLKLASFRMGVKRENLILMHQSHSSKVFEIKNKRYKKIIKSDAMITKINGIVLAVVTADCVPILIYDEYNKIVGCIHAGWKGAFSGIIKKTVLKIKKDHAKTRIFACLGPCIGYESYEVDKKFYNKFVLRSKNNVKYFKKKNSQKKLFNLRKFVADQLIKCRVKIDHINKDTFKDKNNFFSYRRSAILNESDYGRCISAIKLI